MSWVRILCAALGVLAFTSGAAAQPAPVAAPADGLRVVFCGTSGPLPVRDRAKPCVAILAGGALYLVDVGPEATENLLTWRQPLAAARAVFLTHLHSDHLGDLGEFNMQSWVGGRPAPLAVVGPAGVDQVASGFNAAYGLDQAFRHAHHHRGEVRLPLAAGKLRARVIRLPRPDADGISRKIAWRDGDLTVTAIAVPHEPVTPAFAYRFDYKGRSVVISGDTRKSDALAKAAQGADVLIHEAQNNDMTRTMARGLSGIGQTRMSAIMTDTLTYHTTPVEAAEVARAAGARRLVLTHLTQAGLPFFTPEAFTRGITDGGALDWRLAQDGMTIDLPAASETITFGQL